MIQFSHDLTESEMIQFYHDLTDPERIRTAQLQEDLNRMGGAIDTAHQKAMQEEMEAEAKKAAAQAADDIREKYRREHPNTWNENRTDAAYRQLANTLKGGSK